jgi:hypothetical protein
MAFFDDGDFGFVLRDAVLRLLLGDHYGVLKTLEFGLEGIDAGCRVFLFSLATADGFSETGSERVVG